MTVVEAVDAMTRDSGSSGYPKDPKSVQHVLPARASSFAVGVNRPKYSAVLQ